MSETTKNAAACRDEKTVKTSSLAAFLEALNGRRGDLDAWLECNNEDEVRAHVLALVKSEREKCAVIVVADDGSVSEDPLRIKVPELVAKQAG